MAKFKFVLKDKGTRNQGWWLQLSSIEELTAYIEKTSPTRYGNVFENFLLGKEYNDTSKEHVPHPTEADLTAAIHQYAGMQNMNFIDAMMSVRNEVALRQLHEIQEHGSIFINCVGGYHSASKYDKCYDIVYRDDLIFPNFKKSDIRITKFPYGQHYYAYIDDMQVKDGDTLKWNTYEEAYAQAERILEA
jgi:hypothetical protein